METATSLSDAAVDPSHESGQVCSIIDGQIVLDTVSDDLPDSVLLPGNPDTDVSIPALLDRLREGATATATLEDVTITGKPSLSAIVSRLRRWGVAVLPGLLDDEARALLEAEFAHLMQNRANLTKPHSVTEAENSCCVRLNRKGLCEATYPVTSALFASDTFRAIADAYLGSDAYQLNHQIYVHHTDATDTPLSGALHFDVTRMLKFWVYLSDGTEANGAMRATPGSQSWLKLLRREYMDRKTPKVEIQNQVDETAHQAIPLTGPAGTVFIFDTDVAHGASPVVSGGQRRIMRGHCLENSVAKKIKQRK